MSPDTATAQTGSTVRSFFLLGLLGLGMINAGVRPAADSIAAHGWIDTLSNGFGSGWPVYLGLAGALSIGAQGFAKAAFSSLDWLFLPLYVIGLLVPSSAFSAACLLGLALAESRHRHLPREWRSAMVIFAALGARELWVSSGMKAMSPVLLHIDASLTADILSLLGRHPVVDGNLVALEDGMTLAVLMTCSSFANISLAMLTWLVVTRWLRPWFARIDYLAMALVAFGVITINLARLTVMGLSPDLYLVAHGPIGATVSEFAILTTTLLITWWGLSRDGTSPQHDGTSPHHDGTSSRRAASAARS